MQFGAQRGEQGIDRAVVKTAVKDNVSSLCKAPVTNRMTGTGKGVTELERRRKSVSHPRKLYLDTDVLTYDTLAYANRHAYVLIPTHHLPFLKHQLNSAA